MKHVKTLFRYLLPILALPYLSGLFKMLSATAYSFFGVNMIAAQSVVSSVTGAFATVLSLLALAGMAVPAILAEGGSLRRARRAHLVFFLAFMAVLLLMLVSTLFSTRLFMLYYTPGELIDIARRYYAVFVLTVVIASGIPCLLSQLINRYSMILTLLACGLTALMINLVAFAVRTPFFSQLAEGMTFALLRVVPFVLVPLRSYAQSFLPAQD